MYAILPHIRHSENRSPIGKMIRKYVCVVMGMVCLESSRCVHLARTWVMMVANTICHDVRRIAVAC